MNEEQTSASGLDSWTDTRGEPSRDTGSSESGLSRSSRTSAPDAAERSRMLRVGSEPSRALRSPPLILSRPTWAQVRKSCGRPIAKAFELSRYPSQSITTWPDRLADLFNTG